jgi:Ser/Thr protein kinase RdoA (MazF antagonist)
LDDPKQIFLFIFLDDIFISGLNATRAIRNPQGKLIVRLRKKNYSLFHFINGEHFNPTKKSFSSIAQAVAKMHKVFLKLEGKYSKDLILNSSKTNAYFNKVKDYSLDDFIFIEEILKKKKTLNESEIVILEKFPNLIEAVKEVKEVETEFSNIKKSIIHSDLHPHNLLIKDNSVQAILDFDGARISEQARDVAFCIYRFGRQFFIRQNNRSKDDIIARATNLKNLFLEKYQKISPLSIQEIKLMPLLLKDEFLRKTLFVLNGIYKDQNHLWATDLPKFIATFEEINYFWKKNE